MAGSEGCRESPPACLLSRAQPGQLRQCGPRGPSSGTWCFRWRIVNKDQPSGALPGGTGWGQRAVGPWLAGGAGLQGRRGAAWARPALGHAACWPLLSLPDAQRLDQAEPTAVLAPPADVLPWAGGLPDGLSPPGSPARGARPEPQPLTPRPSGQNLKVGDEGPCVSLANPRPDGPCRRAGSWVRGPGRPGAGSARLAVPSGEVGAGQGRTARAGAGSAAWRLRGPAPA